MNGTKMTQKVSGSPWETTKSRIITREEKILINNKHPLWRTRFITAMAELALQLTISCQRCSAAQYLITLGAIWRGGSHCKQGYQPHRCAAQAPLNLDWKPPWLELFFNRNKWNIDQWFWWCHSTKWSLLVCQWLYVVFITFLILSVFDLKHFELLCYWIVL